MPTPPCPNLFRNKPHLTENAGRDLQEPHLKAAPLCSFWPWLYISFDGSPYSEVGGPFSWLSLVKWLLGYALWDSWYLLAEYSKGYLQLGKFHTLIVSHTLPRSNSTKFYILWISTWKNLNRKPWMLQVRTDESVFQSRWMLCELRYIATRVRGRLFIFLNP